MFTYTVSNVTVDSPGIYSLCMLHAVTLSAKFRRSLIEKKRRRFHGC